MTQHPWASQFSNIGRRVVLVTHRRSGTHLTIDLLRKQFPAFRSWKRLGEGAHRLYLTLEHMNRLGMTGRSQSQVSPTIETAIKQLSRPPRPIVKTHSLPGFEQWTGELHDFVDELLSDADIICVYRDGRSVLSSLHVYMQYFHPEARCTFGEFIRKELNGMNYVRAWAEHVRQWLDQPNAIPLKFEDIIKNTRQTLEYLQLNLREEPQYVEPLLPRRLRSIWESRWLRLTSRRPEPTTILSDGSNRKHKINWRKDMTAADRAFFHEQAGDMLIRLGYEQSDAWVEESPTSSAAGGA